MRGAYSIDKFACNNFTSLTHNQVSLKLRSVFFNGMDGTYDLWPIYMLKQDLSEWCAYAHVLPFSGMDHCHGVLGLT